MSVYKPLVASFAYPTAVLLHIPQHIYTYIYIYLLKHELIGVVERDAVGRLVGVPHHGVATHTATYTYMYIYIHVYIYTCSSMSLLAL